MGSKLRRSVDELIDILNDLLNAKNRSWNEGKLFALEGRDKYVIHLVPKDFQHPLRDIVSTVEKHFFLVSKLPSTSHSSPTKNNANEEEQLPLITIPELKVVKRQHVFVGTPISQQVHHLFGQNNFHDNSDTELVKNVLDVGNLAKLCLRDARHLASMFYYCTTEQTGFPPMWLLCDHEYTPHVHYLGMFPFALKETKGKTITAVVKIKDYDENGDGSSLHNAKTLHSKFHMALQTETHGFARYNVYGALDNGSWEPDMPQSCITIEFAWDNVREYLQPPPSSSNAIMKICADPEDFRALLPGITNELNILASVFTIAQNDAKEVPIGNVGSEGKFDQAELKKQVLEFLDKLKLQSMGQSMKEAESLSTSPAAAISFGIQESLMRQDLDNTESLWLFMKDLPSTRQMVFCLDLVLQQLLLGEYQPVLYANNQTQIANLMKQAISCTTDNERAEVKAMINKMLTHPASLQAIIDIGIDKLQNDYINYFVKQELVTKDQLNYFVVKTESSSDKLQRLLRLHNILSVVTLAISYARLSHDDLRQLVPTALKFYTSHNHTEIPVFSLSLPAFSTSSSTVKNKCIREFQPQTWVVACTSEGQCTTMVQFDAKDRLQSFVEGNSTFQGNGYTITSAIANQHAFFANFA